METTTQQTNQPVKTDYAAALNQYRKFSCGRSMRQFCEDEGYDYVKFCRYAREGERERGVGSEPSTFLEIQPEPSSGQQSGTGSPVTIREIRVRFTNGLVMSRRGGSDDVRTIDTVAGLDRPVKGCVFGTSTLVYILMEKFWYNTPFNQIVRKLRMNGVKMPKGTLGDNVHRAIEYMRTKLSGCWESAILGADYLMLDETPGLVGLRRRRRRQVVQEEVLLDWASPECATIDSELHRIGENFVRLFAGKGPDFKIDFVDVGRQWENIDIWAEINENMFLIIEDKTETSTHDDQLKRYKASAEREYNGKRSDLCFAYVKTGNEPLSTLKKIEKTSYLVLRTTTETIACFSHTGSTYKR